MITQIEQVRPQKIMFHEWNIFFSALDLGLMRERKDKLKTHTVFGSENYSIGLPEIGLDDLRTGSTTFILAPDESMSGSMIRQGSLVAIEPYHKLIPGTIYYVRWLGKQLIRKLYRERNGIILMPNNPNYQKILVREEELANFHIQGEVVWSFFFHCHISDKLHKVIRTLIIRKDYPR